MISPRLMEIIENKMSRLKVAEHGYITDGIVTICRLEYDKDNWLEQAIYIAYALGKGYKIIIGGE